MHKHLSAVEMSGRFTRVADCRYMQLENYEKLYNISYAKSCGVTHTLSSFRVIMLPQQSAVARDLPQYLV